MQVRNKVNQYNSIRMYCHLSKCHNVVYLLQSGVWSNWHMHMTQRSDFHLLQVTLSALVLLHYTSQDLNVVSMQEHILHIASQYPSRRNSKPWSLSYRQSLTTTRTVSYGAVLLLISITDWKKSWMWGWG